MRNRTERPRPLAGSRDDEGELIHIVGWILFGLLVGIAAGFLLPRAPKRFAVTPLLGIAGAVVGGVLGRTVGWAGDGSSIESVAGILSGCVVPLALYGMWMGRAAR